jgi:outer membrane receptor protein involved in Fe transport
VGERQGILRAAGIARQRLASYSQVDLHAGVRRDSWTANLFVNNVTDKRGVLTGGVGAVPPFAFTYIQPRTLGLALVKEF